MSLIITQQNDNKSNKKQNSTTQKARQHNPRHRRALKPLVVQDSQLSPEFYQFYYQEICNRDRKIHRSKTATAQRQYDSNTRATQEQYNDDTTTRKSIDPSITPG